VIGNPIKIGSTDGFPTSPHRLLGNDRSEEGRERSILFVGRLERDKGFDVLIEAWKSLGPEAPRLSVVGEGKGKADLEALKDERIAILGALSHDRVLELMRSHAVLAVPSLLVENQPTVILEGLASGCNVVSSDVGGIPETLDGAPYSSARGTAGWIVKAGDVAALASSLKLANNDTDVVVRDEREKNRERILSRHRIDVVVADLESVLKSNL
jgi:glycosyltransferase involved in cell wall biosynthesis